MIQSGVLIIEAQRGEDERSSPQGARKAHKMAREIEIITEDNRVYAFTPYNPSFPTQAKKIGGRWNPDLKAWSFDARDEDRVHEMVRNIYGTDGTNNGDLVTVHVPIADYENDKEVRVGGITVLEKVHRDQVPRLVGDNVVRISGTFLYKSGSMRFPTIGENDVILEVRDIPREVAEKENLEIVTETIDRDALLKEKAELEARLAKIDELLAK